MVFRLGTFLTIHVSAVIEIGIIDQGSRMHDLDPYAHVHVIYFASCAAEFQQTSLDMVRLGKFVQDRF